MSRQSCVMPLALCAVISALTVDNSSAVTKSARTSAANELVQEALHREIYGLQNEREQLLQRAIEEQPDFAPARWHQGYVRYQNEWIKADDLPELLADQQRMIDYRHVRERYPATVEGRMELADWCQKRGLHQQERAHLSEVISMQPDHRGARNRLGFVRINGDWISQDEVAETNTRLQQRQRNLRLWQPRIEKILRGLTHPSQFHRGRAVEQLMAIDDPEAAPAIEFVLAGHSEVVALRMVEALGQLSTDDVSLAIARQAIVSPYAAVRTAAARELRGRDRDGYIPLLLSMLYTPVTSGTQVLQAPSGQMFFRQTFVRENAERREQTVVDSLTRRLALPNAARLQAINNVIASDADADLIRDPEIVRENQRIQWMNGRITETLNIVTDQNLPADPTAWWRWWNETNEVFVSGGKPTKTNRRFQRASVGQLVRLDRADGLVPPSRSMPQLPSPSPSPPPSPRRSDCLAAGTMVWTDMGKKPIESMQVGDLVLAQDPESGELTYQPVLQTTLRPSGLLIRVELANGETFQTSGGHLFWVAGEGWVKSRDLQSGMEIHGVGGAIRVSAVGDGVEEATYNLVVADFNNYFVGDSKVLSHDNTVRKPTDAIVPGLAAR